MANDLKFEDINFLNLILGLVDILQSKIYRVLGHVIIGFIDFFYHKISYIISFNSFYLFINCDLPPILFQSLMSLLKRFEINLVVESSNVRYWHDAKFEWW